MALFAEDIRAMADGEILDAIEDKKEELFRLRLDKASGRLENTNLLRYAQHDLARLKTVLRERELAAELAEKEANDG